MSRLIAFGCSSTFGQGLSDCDGVYNPKITQPSKFAWPSVLASLLDLECINMSTPGSSNKRIMYNVKNFKFDKNDVVTILWSMPVRHAIFSKEKYDKNAIIHDLSPSGTGDKDIAYYTHLHDDYDCYVMDNLYKDYTYRILKEKIKDFKFLFFGKNSVNYHYFEDVWWVPEYYNGENLCPDGIHADQKSHQRYAEDLYKLVFCKSNQQ